MDDLKKERLMISIITVSGIGNMVETIVAGWEMWVIPIIIIGTIGIWWMHLTQRTNIYTRTNIYFIFAAFLVFFHGIHDISYYDVSIVVLILMATFTVADRPPLLNLIMLEYVLIMGLQFFTQYKNSEVDLTPVSLIRTVLHVSVVLCMYCLGRILVNSRLTAAKKLDEWKDMVRQNDHDMEDFLSNISHELRTPVNVISGMTTIMQKTNDSSELGSIQDACIRLAHQIEDIQDYTEIKRGELHLMEDNYMCVSLINDVVANYRANTGRDKLELIVDIDPKTPTMLKGDIQKLHKLFRHLLENAIKFTRRGGVYIKVFPVMQEYGINLVIEVTDTGIGMTRADMSRVSKGMYQANKKRNRSTGGIGIGLPIVYGFVHKMGGFVNIVSSKGNGTTVRISIPQQVVDTTPCLAIKEEAKKGILFYFKEEKFKVPEVREFYKNMVVDLASGLKVDMYLTGERSELERLTREQEISHIFIGAEEYTADPDLMEALVKMRYKVVVFAKEGFSAKAGIIVMPKPLYAFPVVRAINGEGYDDGYEYEDKEKISFRGVTALIVDDEPMNLVVASGLLKDYGMVIDTAESGKMAVDKYEKADYNVIFMDHMMPGMDGVEAMKLIRQTADADNRRPIVIALTANALSGAREMFMQEGFDGFIAKPIDIGEFERVMKNVLPEELISYEGRA